MKRFIPKQFLDGTITQDNCCHELLSTSGFDEGMYGTSYECLICGKHIYYGIYDRQDINKKFVFRDYGCLTPNNINLTKNMLTFIAQRYINEKSLDIAAIFNSISPELENISSQLNMQTEKDKELTKKKYQNI